MLKGNVKRSAGASPTSGRVLFFNDDFLNVLDAERQRIGEERPVVFLDPPWGGVAYKKQVKSSVSRLAETVHEKGIYSICATPCPVE